MEETVFGRKLEIIEISEEPVILTKETNKINILIDIKAYLWSTSQLSGMRIAGIFLSKNNKNEIYYGFFDSHEYTTKLYFAYDINVFVEKVMDDYFLSKFKEIKQYGYSPVNYNTKFRVKYISSQFKIKDYEISYANNIPEEFKDIIKKRIAVFPYEIKHKWINYETFITNGNFKSGFKFKIKNPNFVNCRRFKNFEFYMDYHCCVLNHDKCHLHNDNPYTIEDEPEKQHCDECIADNDNCICDEQNNSCCPGDNTCPGDCNIYMHKIYTGCTCCYYAGSAHDFIKEPNIKRCCCIVNKEFSWIKEEIGGFIDYDSNKKLNIVHIFLNKTK